MPPLTDDGWALLVILICVAAFVLNELVGWWRHVTGRVEREQAARARALLREIEQHEQ